MESQEALNAVYAKWEKKGRGSIQCQKSEPRSQAEDEETNRVPSLLTEPRLPGRPGLKDAYADNVRPRSRAPKRLQSRARRDKLPASAPRLHFFKVEPMLMDSTSLSSRPFTGRACSKCVPVSRNTFFNENTSTMGVRNMLDILAEHRDEEEEEPPGMLGRLFYTAWFSVTRRVDHYYPSTKVMHDAVLSCARVREAMHKTIIRDCEEYDDNTGEFQLELRQQEKLASAIFNKMASNIWTPFIRFTGWFLHKALGHLLSSIQVHRGQIDMIKQAAETGMPLVFLPTHRSHLDYILLTFLLWNHEIQAPHVAAGDNLRIPFFSSLMCHLGGFFIRRKLDDVYGKKDYVYRAVLHTYMEELLRQGQSLEFFIEGGRTRTGKAVVPKGGLLSVVVDAYMAGAISDVYLVPVSFSYEKTLEGNFRSEEMGIPKKKETFLQAVMGVWSAFRSSFGQVRADFAQPMSLQEYLDSAESPGGAVFSRLAGNDSPSEMRRIGSDHSIYGTDIVKEEQRLLVKGLAEHVLYNAVQTTAIMSTQLVAFMFLAVHRQGATWAELEKSFEHIRSEILLRGRDVGFTGNASAVLRHAMELLGNQLFTWETPSNNRKKNQNNNHVKREEERRILIPNLGLPSVFDLTYYGSNVMSVFLIESVLATAMSAVSEGLANTVHLQEGEHMVVSRQALLLKAKELSQLLQMEFIFAPSCSCLEDAVRDGLDSLLHSDLLLTDEQDSTSSQREKQWADQLAFATSWEDQAEDIDGSPVVQDLSYRLNTAATHIQKLGFLQSILAGMVEAYWVSASHLEVLQGGDMTEEKYLQSLQKFAIRRVEDGVATRSESCSSETLKNSLKMLSHRKVISHFFDSDGTRKVELYGGYRDNQELTRFIDSVGMFKTW
ncbi:GPAM [Branchiostoma lanceolatum]|uniref:GPAM protein n=2 Tax=Branchiostoma lanceolatum TaxID=7740 RepID=A0A8J9ZME9_BRALA|nr:GPAM [Branchiostoma lanceolatum]